MTPSSTSQARPEQLLSLAETLNVSVEDWWYERIEKARHRSNRKMKQLSEAASQLPHSQQQKLAAVLEAFVNQRVTR